jgi:hypothetical protein
MMSAPPHGRLLGLPVLVTLQLWLTAAAFGDWQLLWQDTMPAARYVSVLGRANVMRAVIYYSITAGRFNYPDKRGQCHIGVWLGT